MDNNCITTRQLFIFPTDFSNWNFLFATRGLIHHSPPPFTAAVTLPFPWHSWENHRLGSSGWGCGATRLTCVQDQSCHPKGAILSLLPPVQFLNRLANSPDWEVIGKGLVTLSWRNKLIWFITEQHAREPDMESSIAVWPEKDNIPAAVLHQLLTTARLYPRAQWFYSCIIYGNKSRPQNWPCDTELQQTSVLSLIQIQGFLFSSTTLSICWKILPHRLCCYV